MSPAEVDSNGDSSAVTAGLTSAPAFPYCPPALTRLQRSTWIEVRSPRFAEPIWADRRRTRSLGLANPWSERDRIFEVYFRWLI